MNHFTRGFGSEITKLAGALGALGSVGRFAIKRPLLTLGGLGIGASTVMAAKGGRDKGLSGGEEGRYLHARYDPVSRRTSASPAAYTNFNKLMKDPQADRKTNKRVSKNYKEKTFKR